MVNPYVPLNVRIFIAGHRGLVGSAICRELIRLGYTNLITRTHKELDLTNSALVSEFFTSEKPQQLVGLAAAKVGGILANNTYPADFIRDNLDIQNNVIDSAHKSGVDRLLFLGFLLVFIRKCRRSLCQKAACSPDHSSRPTAPMR